MLYENEYEFKMSLGVKNWILRCDWDNCFRYALLLVNPGVEMN